MNEPERSSNQNLVMGVVVSVLVGLLVVAAIFFGATSSSDQRVSSDAGDVKATTSEPTTTIDTTAPETTDTTSLLEMTPPQTSTLLTTPTTALPFASVAALPPGLLCRDLRARGLPYAMALEYWQRNGRSDQMDVDGNGIPCETVYSRTEIAGQGPTDPRSTSTTIPANPFCRDLVARGYSYASSVAYWLAHGRPPRMDADGNGKPCETAYPSSDVSAYWPAGR